MAFIYDIFRIKRKKVKSGTLMTYIEDLVYWVIAAFVIFSTVYLSNDGEIRSFVILGTLIGIILYTIFLSKIVVTIILALIKILTKIIISLWKLITYPMIIIYKIFRIPLGFLFGRLAKLMVKTKRVSRTNLSILIVKRRIFKNSRKKI